MLEPHWTRVLHRYGYPVGFLRSHCHSDVASTCQQHRIGGVVAARYPDPHSGSAIIGAAIGTVLDAVLPAGGLTSFDKEKAAIVAHARARQLSYVTRPVLSSSWNARLRLPLTFRHLEVCPVPPLPSPVSQPPSFARFLCASTVHTCVIRPRMRNHVLHRC